MKSKLKPLLIAMLATVMVACGEKDNDGQTPNDNNNGNNQTSTIAVGRIGNGSITIGDYVLTGGELAAAVIADTVIRLIPGVIGDEQSALGDSFQDGLLAPPEYTRPPEFRGWRVPDVLLSGNHAKIEQWRYEQALQRTKERRPDLIKAISEK